MCQLRPGHGVVLDWRLLLGHLRELRHRAVPELYGGVFMHKLHHGHVLDYYRRLVIHRLHELRRRHVPSKCGTGKLQPMRRRFLLGRHRERLIVGLRKLRGWQLPAFNRGCVLLGLPCGYLRYLEPINQLPVVPPRVLLTRSGRAGLHSLCRGKPVLVVRP